mmetsp:Transcript_174341/g.558887  ORF Transcript_174341/g.558887 Transcript_174341/m.558887 type:complete len:247 (-) Transcript_174341:33-773(-)
MSAQMTCRMPMHRHVHRDATVAHTSSMSSGFLTFFTRPPFVVFFFVVVALLMTDCGFFASSAARAFISASLAFSLANAALLLPNLTLMSRRSFMGTTFILSCNFWMYSCSSSSYTCIVWCDGFSKPPSASSLAVAFWWRLWLFIKESAARRSRTSRNQPSRRTNCVVVDSSNSIVNLELLKPVGKVLLDKITWLISCSEASGGPSCGSSRFFFLTMAAARAAGAVRACTSRAEPLERKLDEAKPLV